MDINIRDEIKDKKDKQLLMIFKDFAVGKIDILPAIVLVTAPSITDKRLERGNILFLDNFNRVVAKKKQRTLMMKTVTSISCGTYMWRIIDSLENTRFIF